ncbi:DUF1801 domain-containing protein [Hamadaea tsunoensis]|uniref:DUF1801 domain-containing protein n=1 Tax=Hamadaea tsunoensis TaxID=53368 RepID=UPI00040292FC|nr:DUF1801 domain-containing protein [Hamadaea tsunoensis]
MAKFSTIDEYAAAQPEDLRAVTEKMIYLIDGALPGTGALWQGHPVWSLGAAPGKQPVCLIKAYASYVTFGLWRGRELDDPDGRIDAKGGMAHVKLRGPDDIDAALFTRWLTQAAALERAA